MTKAQENAIERIKRLALNEHGKYADEYEIKEWEVDENEYFVSLVVETGLKGDEGTMAAIFGRDRAHLFIGKKGGITYPVSKNGKHYTKRFKGYSILQAVVDQR